jgi:DNA invertase Pin-like site-specific DNA recombinase
VTGQTVTRAVGYVRRSTSHQDITLEVQEAAIRAASEQRGMALVGINSDDASGQLHERPGLDAALGLIEAGFAATLVVAKLDRLSRSVVHLGQLLDRAKRGGWNIVALDLGLDLSTPSGELVANVMGAVAQWERRAISDRTREALRSLPRERRNGRPVYDEQARDRARALRADGLTLREVGAVLASEGVTPPRGGSAIGPSAVLRMLED